MRKAMGAAVMIAASATSAWADEPFGADVWLASPQLCEEAKTAGSVRKILDDGNLVLSAKGLRGADFQCRFVQMLKAPDIDAWVATSLCRQEGAGDFPNMYSVSKGADGRLTLVTVYDDEEPTASDDGAVEPDDGTAAPDAAAGNGTAAPAAPATGGTAAAGAQAGTAAAPEAPATDDGAAPEDVGVGDVYSRCEGVPAP